MLRESKLLVTAVAAIDESKVEQIRQAMRTILAQAVRAAKALRAVWLVVGIVEAALAAIFVICFREPNSAYGAASIAVGVTFFVLLALIAALIWALSIIAGLPKMIDAIAEAASKVIVDAKADYAAISKRTGWLGSLHAIWAAGKILRKTLATLQAHECRIRGLEIIAPLISPAGWAAMAALAAACVLVPLIASILMAIRWMSA